MSSTGGRRAERKRDFDMEMEEFKNRNKKIFYEREGGTIPIAEIRELLKGDDEHIRMLERADYNQDQQLSYKEFLEAMRQPCTRWQSVLASAVKTVVPPSKRSKHYVEHWTCYPPPIFIFTISLIELIVFIVYAVLLKNQGVETSFRSGVPLFSPLTYNPYRRYEVWRFLTYMLVHAGYSHLLANLVLQLFIGLPLELFHRWWRIGSVYFLGVIAGSLATSIFDNSKFLVGASGGCYALIGCHFATIIMNWSDMTRDMLTSPFKFIFSAPVQLLFWTLYCALDLFTAIYATDESISYTAHLAGGVAGVLMGMVVLRNVDVLKWEKKLWWVALVAYIALVIIAIFWNIFYPNYPTTDWKKCCPEKLT